MATGLPRPDHHPRRWRAFKELVMTVTSPSAASSSRISRCPRASTPAARRCWSSTSCPAAAASSMRWGRTATRSAGRVRPSGARAASQRRPSCSTTCAAGKPDPALTWGLHRYQVVILKEFEADFQQSYEIPYSHHLHRRPRRGIGAGLGAAIGFAESMVPAMPSWPPPD